MEGERRIEQQLAAGPREIHCLSGGDARIELERRRPGNYIRPGPRDGGLEIELAGRRLNLAGIDYRGRDRARPGPAGLLERPALAMNEAASAPTAMPLLSVMSQVPAAALISSALSVATVSPTVIEPPFSVAVALLATTADKVVVPPVSASVSRATH